MRVNMCGSKTLRTFPSERYCLYKIRSDLSIKREGKGFKNSDMKRVRDNYYEEWDNKLSRETVDC